MWDMGQPIPNLTSSVVWIVLLCQSMDILPIELLYPVSGGVLSARKPFRGCQIRCIAFWQSFYRSCLSKGYPPPYLSIRTVSICHLHNDQCTHQFVNPVMQQYGPFTRNASSVASNCQPQRLLAPQLVKRLPSRMLCLYTRPA